VPARQRLARAGGTMQAHTVVTAWSGGAATLRSTLTGAESVEPFEWMVIAETPTANSTLAAALREGGVPFHEIGDCVAPRRASLAFYEGRDLARQL